MNLESILTEISDKNLIAVRFEQTDTNGIARSKTIPVCHFEEKATKGLAFNICHLGRDVQCKLADHSGFGEELGFPDALTFPDPETFKVLPWAKRKARILIEPTYKGEYVSAHPRVLARRQLQRLSSIGISLLSAHEYEFYVFDKQTMKPINDDINMHASIRDTHIEEFLFQIMEYLPQVGVLVECVENVMGPGQLEISYKPAFGIRAADNAHTYRTSIKEIALLNGYVASFMSKPYPDKSGSSAHFCHSLWDVAGKVPLLYDANDPTNLSELGQHWLAGILYHAPAIEVLMAPTVNCRKRVKACCTACPINATWGYDNRSCALRVKINGEKGTYFENRTGAAGGNPYLSLAATVAAGIDGIVNKMQLPPAVTGNAAVPDDVPAKTQYLPTNMEDAIRFLINDDVICNALGEDFIKCFTAIRLHEAKLERDAQERGDKDWEFNYFAYYL